MRRRSGSRFVPGLALAAATTVGASQWVEVTQPGPSARNSQAMVYDGARETIWLFGGRLLFGPIFHDDTWAWDGAAWRPIDTPVRPSARGRAFYAYDADRAVMVVYGGYDGVERLADTWEWDGATWRSVDVSGPGPRQGGAMVFDPDRGVVVLFGGWDGTSFLGDTWEYDGEHWTPVASDGPPPRSAYGLAHDPRRGVAVLFGGEDSDRRYDDTWEWDGLVWTRVATTGPTARKTHAMAYSSELDATVLFSGWNGDLDDPVYYADSWAWDGALWRPLGEPGPPPRDGHTLVADERRGGLVAFGGRLGPIAWGDTWQLRELVLAHDPLVRGAPVRFVVEGARPGELVTFVGGRSRDGDAICPGVDDGGCLDLTLPARRLGSAVADAEGTAELELVLPAGTPLGAHYAQAVGGDAAVKSNLVLAPVVP